MMKYLTRPGDPRTKEEKKEVVADFKRQSADFWKKKDAEAKPKAMNLLKYIDTVNKNYGDSDIKIKSDEEYERLNPTKKAPAAPVTPPKKTITKTYDSPIGTIKEIKKVVEVKPKTNGAYKMPKSNFDSFDWDLFLREHDKDYMTLEDEDKLVSQPSIDESNATWWENMYYDYKKSGGELNFHQFRKMLLKEGDIGDLDAKKRLDGIRKILIA